MTQESERANVGGGGGEGPLEHGRLYAVAVALAALAGFVDATGYIHFHKLFVSFMSGNSTQAMVAAAQGDAPTFETVARTILLFVAGVTVGELVAAISSQWGRPLVLSLELALLGVALAAAVLAWDDAWCASSLALAMGVQNAAVHKAEGISVALTYVTGTLVHVGRGIAAALRGQGPWHAPLPFVGLWAGLVVGGVIGALVATGSLVRALVVATAACAALLIWATGVALAAKPS